MFSIRLQGHPNKSERQRSPEVAAKKWDYPALHQAYSMHVATMYTDTDTQTHRHTDTQTQTHTHTHPPTPRRGIET